MMTETNSPGGESDIVMYGTAWCGDCTMAKSVLDSAGIAYRWIDIDDDVQAEAFVIKSNAGNRSVPTILWPDGRVLVEPSRAELLDAIAALG